MRPFGIRARPPLCAARAAATWSELVNDTRKASLPTPNVTSAPDDGAVGMSSLHTFADSAAIIGPATNIPARFLTNGPPSTRGRSLDVIVWDDERGSARYSKKAGIWTGLTIFDGVADASPEIHFWFCKKTGRGERI
jgi:hypothetical protein